MSPLRLTALVPLLACLATLGVFEPPAEPQPVAEGRQPQAAVDDEGVIWLTYARGRTIWLRSSTDGGESFGEEMKVADVPAMDLGMRRGPRVAVTDQGLLITCIAGEQARGRDGDLLAWLSTDGGTSWSDPRMLNSASGSAREGLQATAAAGKHVAVVWLDMREKGTTLFGAFSEDGGRTFTPDRQIYVSPSGSICECCAPQLAVDADGRVAVLFRNSIDGARDMYLIKSADGGKTFSAARKHGEQPWLIDACPMDGGSVVLAGDQVTAVWRRQEKLYRSKEAFDDQSTEPAGEALLGAGFNASLAEGAGVKPYAYTGENGEVMCAWLGGEEAMEVAKFGQDPVAVWSPKAKGPLVLWENGGKVFARLVERP